MASTIVMRVDVALEHLAVDLALGPGELRIDRQQVDGLEQVDHNRVVARATGRVFDLWLEVAPEEKHDIGIDDVLDLLRLELDVVRTLAGRRDADHLDEVTPDPAGGFLDRIEGGGHAHRPRRTVVAAARSEGSGHDSGEEDGAGARRASAEHSGNLYVVRVILKLATVMTWSSRPPP
jgi:hypothetical protein